MQWDQPFQVFCSSLIIAVSLDNKLLFQANATCPSILESTMATSTLFHSGIQIASFVTSSDLLQKSWDAILCGHGAIISNEGEGLAWNVYEEPDSDLKIIAFEATLNPSDIQADLVASSSLREEKFLHFDFLYSRKVPFFSVNSTAISLFCKNHQRLDQFRSEINSSTRLIVTGLGLGGSVASLFTISLLDSIRLGKNRPLCITFGSPLIGDKRLQQAISRSPIWNSCFLHVVSLKDPLPWLFIANHSSPNAAFTPRTNAYMPFGTFLLCSGVNSTCFENPDSVLELLIATGPIHVRHEGFQYGDYGNIVKNLNRKAVCKDLTTLPENMSNPESNSVLASSISLQLRALLGVAPHMQQQQQNIDINSLEKKMEIKERGFIIQRKVKYSPIKKLNVMKIEMAKLEWYRKYCMGTGLGYYNAHKQMALEACRDAVSNHKNLTIYWEEMVEEAEINPQKGNAALRKSWLYAGTSYRRMVEPLAIAEYYSNGGTDYITNRHKHFVLLEEWFRNEMTKSKTSNEEDICDLDCDWNWDSFKSIDNLIRSSRGSIVGEEWEDNSLLNLTIDDENDEAISSTTCFSYWSRTNQLLLSSKKLNVIEENEENSNTTSESNDNKYSSIEACVDVSLISCKGSVKEENIKKFESPVDEALLSRLGSMSIAVKELDEIINRTKKKNVKLLLTIDSCFWAHVEEAVLLCRKLEIIEEKEEVSRKLDEFEEYVYGLLKNYEVSPDIFLPYSSYMGWWELYKAIKGTSYNSALASFMNDVRNYDQYALGDYDFF